MSIISMFDYEFDTELTEEDVIVQFEDFQSLMDTGFDYCAVMNNGEYLGVPSMHHFGDSLSEMLKPHLRDLQPGSYVFERVSVEGTNVDDPDNSPDAKLSFQSVRPATEIEIDEWVA